MHPDETRYVGRSLNDALVFGACGYHALFIVTKYNKFAT